jgi:hypothetical protein
MRLKGATKSPFGFREAGNYGQYEKFNQAKKGG